MTEGSPGSSVPRRQLGRMLRRTREEGGIRIEDIVAEGYLSRPTMWRLEKGDPNVRYRRGDIENLARFYGVDDETMQVMVGLALATKQKGWLHAYGDVIPETFELYVDLEAVANEFRWYESELVPGILQTKDYATAVISAPKDCSDDEARRRVEVRLARQALLTRKKRAPKFNFVINEAILRRPVGGPAVMAEQLRRINEASELPNVTVRVAPFDVGLHHGVMSGPFEILYFPKHANGDSEPTTVFLDGICGELYFDQEHQIRQYEAIFEDLQNNSLDESKSREWIEQAARRFDQQ